MKAKGNKIDGHIVAIVLLLTALLLFVFGFQYIEEWVYDIWPYDVGKIQPAETDG